MSPLLNERQNERTERAGISKGKEGRLLEAEESISQGYLTHVLSCRMSKATSWLTRLVFEQINVMSFNSFVIRRHLTSNSLLILSDELSAPPIPPIVSIVFSSAALMSSSLMVMVMAYIHRRMPPIVLLRRRLPSRMIQWYALHRTSRRTVLHEVNGCPISTRWGWRGSCTPRSLAQTPL